MKIIELTTENVKRLKAARIVPDENVVVISGRNGQGKTSVLDAIMWALAGAAAVQGKPLRDGETNGRINVKLGNGDVVDLIVERRFTQANGKGDLWVESADGARFKSPQAMLDALVGELSFDPTAFTRMEPTDQLNELRRLVKLDVDVDKLDAQNAGDYQRRADINRDAKAKRAQIGAIAVPADTPAEPIDESALLTEMTQAADANTDLEKRRQRREQMAATIKMKRETVSQFQKEAEELRKQAAELQERALRVLGLAGETTSEADAMQAKLDAAEALPAPTDLQAVRQKLDSARATNKHVQAAQNRAKLITEAEALEKQAAELTAAMEARAKAKADAIKAAKMPIDGLSFGDGMVLYKGMPFDQSSDAEQIQVSMAVAMAANPKLRVIRIRDGSLLDEQAMGTINGIAAANDFQVWVERVDSSGKVGIVIEDGEVASTPGSRAEQEQREQEQRG